MEKVIKTFKSNIKSVNDADKTVDVIVSTAATDRHMESIVPDAFKKRIKVYKDHPILLSSHDYYDLRKQIGEAVQIRVTEEGLFARFKYYVGMGNDEADWAYMLASKGVAAFSVGFIPYESDSNDLTDEDIKSGKKPWRTYKDVELIEISQVLIPSNRDAIQEQVNKARSEHYTGVGIELCTKALQTKDLLKESAIEDSIKDFGKVISEEVDKAMAKNIFDGIKELNDDGRKPHAPDPDQLPPEPETLEEVEQENEQDKSGVTFDNSLMPEIKFSSGAVRLIFKSIQKDEALRSEFKSLVLSIVEEVVEEDSYKKLIFGKAVSKEDHSPTLREEMGNSFKKIIERLNI